MPIRFDDICLREAPLQQQLLDWLELAGSAAAAAAAGLAGFSKSALAEAVANTIPGAKPLPAYVSWKDQNSMIVHSASTVETKRSAFGTSIITPNDRLYIRNNLPAPDASIVADRDAWEVTIEGVKNPRTLSVKELKSMGLSHSCFKKPIVAIV